MPSADNTRTYKTMPPTPDELRLANMKVLHAAEEKELAASHRAREKHWEEKIKAAKKG